MRGMINKTCYYPVTLPTKSQMMCSTVTMHSVSQKKIPLWFFLTFFPKWLGMFSPNAYYTFLSMLDCKFLFNYLQLWWSYAILSTTTIICSKRPPSVKTHAGWLHLIWHNFVKVGDNWIKICSLAQERIIGVQNLDPKYPTVWEKCQKMPVCVLADGGHFEHVVWTGWSRLIWHNFVKIADN